MRLTKIRRATGIGLTISLLFLTLPVRAGDRATDCHGEQQVCRILIAGERELASMLVSGDVAIVDRLFADDAVWSLASGERWTKRQAMETLRTAPRMASSRLLHASVRQHGGVAIVLWEESWIDPKMNREQRSFGTDTWMLRRARWQIIASQEVRPAAPAARHAGSDPSATAK